MVMMKKIMTLMWLRHPRKRLRRNKQRKRVVPKKQGDDLKLPEPTPEDIALYSKRPRKVVPKAKESASQREAKAALEELTTYATEPFYLDVRVIRQPKGITCSRNRYGGHVTHLVQEIHVRGALFPVKTIYVALGNVSTTISIML